MADKGISNNKVREAAERAAAARAAEAQAKAAAAAAQPDRLTEALSGFRGVSAGQLGAWGAQNRIWKEEDRQAAQSAFQQAAIAALGGAGRQGGGDERIQLQQWLAQQEAAENERNRAWQSVEKEKEFQRQLELARYNQTQQAQQQAAGQAPEWEKRVQKLGELVGAGMLTREQSLPLMQQATAPEENWQQAVLAALGGSSTQAQAEEFAKQQLTGLNSRAAMRERVGELWPALTPEQQQAMQAQGQMQYAALPVDEPPGNWGRGAVLTGGAAGVLGAGAAGLYGLGKQALGEAAPGALGTMREGVRQLGQTWLPQALAGAKGAVAAHPYGAAALAALLGTGALAYGLSDRWGGGEPLPASWEEVIKKYQPGQAQALTPEDVLRALEQAPAGTARPWAGPMR